MKKVLIILAFVLVSTFVGVGASNLYEANLTSQGHITATDDAIQIDGGSTATADGATTFSKIDPDQARYAPVGSWSSTFTFESTTDVTVQGTLTMYLNGEVWNTDKFDVLYQYSNTTSESQFSLEGGYPRDVEIIVYLHDDLAFDEMGQDVSLEITFKIV